MGCGWWYLSPQPLQVFAQPALLLFQVVAVAGVDLQEGLAHRLLLQRVGQLLLQFPHFSLMEREGENSGRKKEKTI